MSRYVIFNDPPSVASLYDDWSENPVSWSCLSSDALSAQAEEALNESYDDSVSKYKAKNTFQAIQLPEEALLPPPSQMPQPSNSIYASYINESSYTNEGPSAVLHLPDYKFDATRLIPLGQCAPVFQHAKTSGEPGAKHAHVIGFVSSVEPIKTVTQRGNAKKVLEVHIGDETGSLVITAWDSKAEGLVSQIRLGDVIYLSGQSP